MLYKALTGISYEPTGKEAAWKRWVKGEIIDTSKLPTPMPIEHLLENGDIEGIPVAVPPEIP